MNLHPILTDDLLEAMLARRAGPGAPDDLAAAIATDLEALPEDRRPWWSVLVPSTDLGPALRMAWVVAVVGLLLAVTVSTVFVGSQLVRRANELSVLPAPSVTPTPFHPIPADFVTVYGTGDCLPTDTEGVDPETGGPGWRVTCSLEMSDPRVSGTEIGDRVRLVERDGVGYVWIAEEATITNDEGSWRGVIQAADDGSGRNGEGHFVGEGAYEGLEYHYYFGVSGNDGDWRHGWIYSSGE